MAQTPEAFRRAPHHNFISSSDFRLFRGRERLGVRSKRRMPQTHQDECLVLRHGRGRSLIPGPALKTGFSSGSASVENTMWAAENARRSDLTWSFSGPGIAIPKNIEPLTQGRRNTCHFTTGVLAAINASPNILSAKYCDSGSAETYARSISPPPLESSATSAFTSPGLIVRHWTICFNRSCSKRAFAALSLACAVAVTCAAREALNLSSLILPDTARAQAQITPTANAHTPTQLAQKKTPSAVIRTLKLFFFPIAFVICAIGCCIGTMIWLARTRPR